MKKHKDDRRVVSWVNQYQKAMMRISKSAFCILCSSFFLLQVPASAQKSNKAVRQGNDAYRQADFATAIKNYAKALLADNKNAVARFNMANAYQHNNDAAKAMQTYDDAIKIAPDADLQSKAYYNKGLSQLQQKNITGAIDAFKQSLRLTPNDNEARENLQKALEEMKRQQQQQQKQDNKQPPQSPPKQQKQQPKMNQQMMEQKFKELQQQEKELQQEIQKQKTNQPDPEKDW